LHTYANTIPTPQGGTHEAGFRAALVKGLRAYGELKKEKRSAAVTAEDLIGGLAGMCSRSSSATRIFQARPRTS